MVNEREEFKKLQDVLVEQKITQQVTITTGSTDTVEIDVPNGHIIYLKGYGYSWFSSNTYSLDTGNKQFKGRTDQEGSPAIPMIFGVPFKVRSGGKLLLRIKNGDTVDHTYDVVFYILTNDHLDIASTGGELSIPNTTSGGAPSQVSITDSTGTTTADVVARGDGKNALVVDTELIIHGGTFVIDNMNVASTDQTAANSKYIKVDANGVLDMRVLSDATDSVEVLQNTAADLNATVVATDLDIRDLANATDSVTAHIDSTNNIVQDKSFSGGSHTSLTIAATATAEQLATLTCRNVRLRASTVAGTIYIGFSNSVTGVIYFEKIDATTDYVDIPVSNTNLIWVYGTLNDVIQISVMT